MAPHISNHRAACEEVMKLATQQQPVFTMQQDYTLISEGCPFSGGFLMGDTPGVPIKNSPGAQAAVPRTCKACWCNAVHPPPSM
jgi:hypothetical protein